MARRSPHVASWLAARGERENRASGLARAYDDHVWRVYGYFAYRLHSRYDAEDLTQLTFERALRAWNRFDAGQASVATWLLTIAHNLLVDHYRGDRSQSHRPLGDDQEKEAALGHLELHAEGLGVSPELAAGLDKLGQREREVIALRFGGDLTGPEIAKMMGLSLASVQQTLSRSLRRLRAELEQSPPAKGRISA